jgi:hypothetical protein
MHGGLRGGMRRGIRQWLPLLPLLLLALCSHRLLLLL